MQRFGSIAALGSSPASFLCLPAWEFEVLGPSQIYHQPHSSPHNVIVSYWIKHLLDLPVPWLLKHLESEHELLQRTEGFNSPPNQGLSTFDTSVGESKHSHPRQTAHLHSWWAADWGSQVNTDSIASVNSRTKPSWSVPSPLFTTDLLQTCRSINVCVIHI